MKLLKSIFMVASLVFAFPLQAAYPPFTIESKGLGHPVGRLCVSPDGKFLVTTFPKSVDIYNIETGALHATCQTACKLFFPQVFFSSDSTTLFIMELGRIYRYQITKDGISPLIEVIIPKSEKPYLTFNDFEQESGFGDFGKIQTNTQYRITCGLGSYAAVVQENETIKFFKLNRSAYFSKNDGFAHPFNEKDFFITTRLPDETITSQPISINFPSDAIIPPSSSTVISPDATRGAFIFFVRFSYATYVRIVDLKLRSVLYECEITSFELCSVNFSPDNSKLLIAYNRFDPDKTCFDIIDLTTNTEKELFLEKSYIDYAAFVTNTKIFVSQWRNFKKSVQYIDITES